MLFPTQMFIHLIILHCRACEVRFQGTIVIEMARLNYEIGQMVKIDLKKFISRFIKLISVYSSWLTLR